MWVQRRGTGDTISRGGISRGSSRHCISCPHLPAMFTTRGTSSCSAAYITTTLPPLLWPAAVAGELAGAVAVAVRVAMHTSPPAVKMGAALAVSNYGLHAGMQWQ